MTRYSLFILSIIFFSYINCRNKGQDDWKQIDTGSFLIEVPNRFIYEEKQGIDSQLGEIKGDSLKFFFDFGCYADENPRTNEEFAEQMLLGPIPHNELHKKLSLSDTISRESVLAQVKILNLDTTSWTTTIRYRDSLFYIPIEIFWYDEDDDRRNYLFQIDSIGNWRRKIFYPKNKAAKRSGIVLRGKFNKTINNYQALALSIHNGQPKDSVMIMRILKSIRIKQ